MLKDVQSYDMNEDGYKEKSLDGPSEIIDSLRLVIHS